MKVNFFFKLRSLRTMCYFYVLGPKWSRHFISRCLRHVLLQMNRLNNKLKIIITHFMFLFSFLHFYSTFLFKQFLLQLFVFYDRESSRKLVTFSQCMKSNFDSWMKLFFLFQIHDLINTYTMYLWPSVQRISTASRNLM